MCTPKWQGTIVQYIIWELHYLGSYAVQFALSSYKSFRLCVWTGISLRICSRYSKFMSARAKFVPSLTWHTTAPHGSTIWKMMIISTVLQFVQYWTPGEFSTDTAWSSFTHKKPEFTGRKNTQSGYGSLFLPTAMHMKGQSYHTSDFTISRSIYLFVFFRTWSLLSLLYEHQTHFTEQVTANFLSNTLDLHWFNYTGTWGLLNNQSFWMKPNLVYLTSTYLKPETLNIFFKFTSNSELYPNFLYHFKFSDVLHFDTSISIIPNTLPHLFFFYAPLRDHRRTSSCDAAPSVLLQWRSTGTLQQ